MYIPPSHIKTKTILHIPDLSNTRVLLRSCLNIKVDDNGACLDATRFQDSLQTISYLAKRTKKLYITGHLGRPKRKEHILSFRRAVSPLLQQAGIPHILIDSTDKLATYDADDTVRVVLIENIRFFSGEESKDAAERLTFARSLAKYADIYVNDAFADYRKSVSTFDIAKLLPSYIGIAMDREIQMLGRLHNPIRPFVCVMGGAKLSEKLDVLSSVAAVADKVLVGGAMAYTLLKSQGHSIGNSLYESDKMHVAQDILSTHGGKIILPTDHCVVDVFSKTAQYRFTDVTDISDGAYGIDIGPRSIAQTQSIIATAKTVLWNGPMGISEWAQAATGTRAVATAIGQNRTTIDFAIAGGGDSIAAIESMHMHDVFDYVCTGGGAMLAYLGNNTFPTIDVICQVK